MLTWRNTNRALCLVYVAAVATVACSSGGDAIEGDPGVAKQCGPGTYESSGTCLPEAADAASDTSIDGGGSGEGGADDGSPDAAGDELGDSSPDAPMDTASTWIDDPCPLAGTGIQVNCDLPGGAPACSAGLNPCSATACGAPGGGIDVYSSAQYPYWMRTPSHPVALWECVSLCGAGDTIFGMGVHLEGLNADFRVTVAAPWKIVQGTSPGYCMSAAEPSECVVIPEAPNVYVAIVTNDPNAPARNVRIERVPHGTVCP